MPFKLNIAEKGKTFKLEVDSESLLGKKIGELLPEEFRRVNQIPDELPLWPYYLPNSEITVPYINEMLRKKGLPEYPWPVQKKR